MIAKAKISRSYIALFCCSFFFILMQVGYGPTTAWVWCDGLCGEKILQSKIQTDSVLIDSIYSQDTVFSDSCFEACLEALKNPKIKYVEIRYLENVLTERKNKEKNAENYRYKRFERTDDTQIHCYKNRNFGNPHFSISNKKNKFIRLCVTEKEIAKPTSNYLLVIKARHDDWSFTLLDIIVSAPRMNEQILTNLKNGNTVAFSQDLEFYAVGIYGILIPPFFMNGQFLFERPPSSLTLSLAKVLE